MGRSRYKTTDLFGGSSRERWRRDAEHAEVKVNLSSMMNFVFRHETQPFPRRNVSTRRRAFALKVRVRELGENLNGFGVQALHKRQYVLQAVC